MSVTISGVLDSHTPEEGRLRWNLSDSNLKDALDNHIASSYAHGGDESSGNIVYASSGQTLTNKVISSTNNTVTITAPSISGDFISLQSLEWDSSGSSNVQQPFGYDTSTSSLAAITISGSNGIEVRKINSDSSSKGLNISMPSTIVINNDSQTMALNTSAVQGGETLRIGGAATIHQGELKITGTGASLNLHEPGSVFHLAQGSSILPSTDHLADLGNNSYGFGNLYVDNAIIASGITVSAGDVTMSNGNLSVTGTSTITGDLTCNSDISTDNLTTTSDLTIGNDIIFSQEANQIINKTNGALSIQSDNFVTIEDIKVTGNQVGTTSNSDLLNLADSLLTISEAVTVSNGLLTLNAAGLNVGTGNITNVGDVDGVDIGAFKSTYDSFVGSDITIELSGDVTGSITDSFADVSGGTSLSITATVGDDSHSHDTQYYTENESDSRFVVKAGITSIQTLENTIKLDNLMSYTAPTTSSVFDGTSTNTKKNQIIFKAMTSSEGNNDDHDLTSSTDGGSIYHETSNVLGDHNKGILHLCPTDDPSGDDYVSIHGTNDPDDKIRLYTSGEITTPGNITCNNLVSNGTISGDFTSINLTGDLNINDNNITNVRSVRFKDWDDDSGGTDQTVYLIRRERSLQVHEAGLRVGSYSNNTTGIACNSEGEGELRVKGGSTGSGNTAIQSDKSLVQYSGYPTPFVVYMHTPFGSGADPNNQYVALGDDSLEEFSFTTPRSGYYRMSCQVDIK